jgi:hypothetical protein
VSYFFCASAPLQDAASTANAAEKTASLLEGISVLPDGEISNVSSHGLS